MIGHCFAPNMEFILFDRAQDVLPYRRWKDYGRLSKMQSGKR